MQKSIRNMHQRPEDEELVIKLDAMCTAAQIVLESGGETYRVEETALRMAEGLGLSDVNVVALPTTIFVEANDRTYLRRIRRRGTNLAKLERVNEISRSVAQGEMSAEMAYELLYDLQHASGVSQRVLIPASGLAAAGFSLIFGGSAGSFIVAFLAGVLTQAVQPFFVTMELGSLLSNFVGGFMTAVFAHAASTIVPYGNVNATIIGGIMPLLSGLLMTTAVRDTVYGDLISGITRSVEAMLIATSVALGVYVGLLAVSVAGGVAV